MYLYISDFVAILQGDELIAIAIKALSEYGGLAYDFGNNRFRF